MVGIAQIEARNALLFELVRAEANPRDVFVGLILDWNAGVPPPLHPACYAASASLPSRSRHPGVRLMLTDRSS